MTDAQNAAPQVATLNTKLEDDFIAPLAAIRGALEILRDAGDLSDEDRRRFVEVALRECARLERGVTSLGEAVYAEASGPPRVLSANQPDDRFKSLSARVHILKELGVIDLDFSDYLFADTKAVNDFYDVIEDLVAATGEKWHFAVNYRDCKVWPEAWVAFAHRGKRLHTHHGLSAIRYAAPPDAEDGIRVQAAAENADPNLLPSREAALEHIAELRRSAA